MTTPPLSSPGPTGAVAAIADTGKRRVPGWARGVQGLVALSTMFLTVREAFYWIDTFRTGCSSTPQVVRLAAGSRFAVYALVVGLLAAALYGASRAGSSAENNETASLGARLRQAPVWTPAAVGVALMLSAFNFAAYIPWDGCRSGGLVEHGPFGLVHTAYPDVFLSVQGTGAPGTATPVASASAESPIPAACVMLCFPEQTRVFGTP